MLTVTCRIDKFGTSATMIIFVFWVETAATRGAESFGLCVVVNIERKCFQIGLKRIESQLPVILGERCLSKHLNHHRSIVLTISRVLSRMCCLNGRRELSEGKFRNPASCANNMVRSMMDGHGHKHGVMILNYSYRALPTIIDLTMSRPIVEFTERRVIHSLDRLSLRDN